MTNKKMGTKLADSLRQMRGENPATSAPPSTASTEKPPVPRAGPPRETQTAGTTTFAKQSDQLPTASLDRPWDNLHPARIWPD